MTRVVSRFYTDYFPTKPPAEDLGIFETSEETNKSKPSVDESGFNKKPITEGIVSKRIFIAKIPSRVSEEDLRKHFEAFGTVEDAYRPRDHAKNTYRGIGFVTFSDPSAVDLVIGKKHSLGGVEVVVDRATPKDTHPPPKSESSTRPSSEDGRRHPWMESVANNLSLSGLQGSFNEQAFDLHFLKSFPTTTYPNSTGNNNCGPPSILSEDFPMEASTGFRELYDSCPSSLMAMANKCTSPTATDSNARVMKNGGSPRMNVKSERSSKNLSDNMAHVRRVRKGPRIFVGKISKDTVEQDLADYFSQFGFVMDVYIPRSKENKKEHRGFGFVTFETEASIKRVVSQGTHSLKGVALAIDVAVPENSSN